MEAKGYRLILKEIIDGFSTCHVGKDKHYIKHQAMADIVDFETVYDAHYERAQNRGLPTEEEILLSLKAEGIWTSKDDAEIEKQTFYVESLQKNKKNLYLKSAINQINKQIEEAEETINTLVGQKQDLISNSCEKYATNRANDYYMFSSFFKDPELTSPLNTQEEFEHIEAKKVSELVGIYNKFHHKFSDKNIQHLVLQDFYKIYYSFSESSVDFFGQPIVKLTNSQLNLIIYTRVFNNIFQQHDDIPDKICKDPAALLDFSNSTEAREEIKKKMTESDVGGSSIVGATKEDLEELGIQPNAGKSLESAAKEKGGSLSMKDLMDLSGV